MSEIDYEAGEESRFGNAQVDFVMQMRPAARKFLAEQTVRQARDGISNRVDQFGVAEPTPKPAQRPRSNTRRLDPSSSSPTTIR